ncbi:MAG: O-antigen polymerase [Pseudomonadota bacterium]
MTDSADVPRSPPLYGKTGVVATITGTALAVLALPGDTRDADGMILPAAIMTCGLGLAPVLASLQHSRALLRMEYLLPFGLVYWLLLDLLQGAGELGEVTAEGVESAFIAIGVFGVGIYAAACGGPWTLPRAIRHSAVSLIGPRTLFALCCTCFALGMFQFAYAAGFDPLAMVFYAGTSRWMAPWSSGRLGGWAQLISHLTYFGYLVPALAVTLGIRIGWSRLATCIAVLMAIVILVFLAQGGGRRVIGVMAGAALVVWILAQPYLDLRRVLVILTSCAVILLSMEVMLEYRTKGLSVFLSEWDVPLDEGRVHVDDNLLRLAQTIEIIPAKHDYVYEKQLVYAAVRPIPRAIWPGKPTGPGFNLGEFLGTPWVSLSSSTVAEWYSIGGFLTVLLGGLAYGSLARAGSALWLVTDRPVGRLVYGVYAMALFAGLRSMLDLVLMSYMLLGWMVVWWLFVGRHRPARPKVVSAAPVPLDRG